jgi:hypothetical protein
MSYIGKSPSGSGVRTRYYFTQSSGGGTSISGTDDNGKTLTYTDGEYVDVYLNGVLLVHGTDYGTGTANTISSLAALSGGDVVEVVVYDIFNVAKINNEAVRKRYYKTASGSETSISGADDSGATITFPANAEIEVKLNGVALVQGTDYNTTSANTVGGLSALSAGQVVEIVVYERFVLGDTVSKADGGTFAGNVGFSGTVDVNGNELILDADADTSITADTDDQIDFKVGGSDKMNLTSTGLHIERASSGGTATSTAALIVEGTDATGADIQILGDDTDYQRFLFGDATDNDVGAIEYSHSGNSMRFHTNASERMRIDSSGNVLLGTTANLDGSSRLNVKYSYTNSGAAWESNNTATHNAIVFKNPNGVVGKIQTSGSATVYATSSDHRLKENVADMTDAIARVKQLAPKRFNFIADDSVTVDGFLAHEAQTVVPEAISGTHNEVDDDGNAVMQGIDQSKLVPLLTAALKESITKIETLETEMTALKARVTALEDA